MRRHSAWTRVVLMVGLLLVAVPWSVAAQDVLELVPENALGFVAVNGLSSVDAKVSALGQKIGTPVPSPLTLLKAKVGVEAGVDEKGTALLVAVPGDSPDAQPRPLIIVPTSDYAKFIAQFQPEKVTDAISKVAIAGGRGLAAQKDGYAIFAESNGQELLEGLLAGKNLAGELGEWKTWIGQCDVAAVMTQGGLTIFFDKGGKAIAQAKETLGAMGGDQGAQAVAVFEMYQKIFEAARGEVTAAGVGVRMEDDGVRVQGMGRFATQGHLAKALADVKPLPAGSLAGLPSGPYVVAGAGPLPAPAVKAMMDLSVDMMKAMPEMYGLDAAQAEAMAKLSTEMMKRIHGMSGVLGVAKEGQPVYNGMIGVMWADDAEAFLAEYAKQIEAMGKLVEGSKTSMFKDMTAEKVDLNGLKGLKVTMDISKMIEAQKIPMQAEMLKKMYGADGKMVVYLAAADKTRVVFGYGDQERIAAAAKAVGDPAAGLAGDAELAKTTAKLPKDAQWVGYWSPQGTLQFVSQTIRAIAPPEANIQLPTLPATPPVGLAITVSSTGVQKELYVPIEVIQTIVQQVIQLRTGPMEQ